MNKLSEELDILLNKFEPHSLGAMLHGNKNIPEEVGSYNTTEDCSDNIDNIRPEDSISNSGNQIKDDDYKIYNIEGQIKILNGEVVELKLNPKLEIELIIENYNKELEIYNKLKEELKEKIKNIDNKEYQNIISKYEREKERIKELNKLENEKLKELHEKNKKYIELDMENRYKNKIKILEDNLENIKAQTEREYKIRLEYEEARNKELENAKINLEKDKEQLLILTNKKAQTKGADGELEIYNYIKSKIELNEKSKIENVSKDKKESSDLYLEHNKLKCVIEIKNHNSTIQKNDIKKFEEVYINQEKYNSGLFISLESNFSPSSCKKDFEIKIINEKPIIYLSNLNENKDKLIIAIKMLNYILENKDDNDYDAKLNILNMQIEQYNILKNHNNEIMKKSYETINIAKLQNIKIEKYIENLETVLFKNNNETERYNDIEYNEEVDIKLEQLKDKIAKSILKNKCEINIKHLYKIDINKEDPLICISCKYSAQHYKNIYNHILKKHNDKI